MTQVVTLSPVRKQGQGMLFSPFYLWGSSSWSGVHFSNTLKTHAEVYLLGGFKSSSVGNDDEPPQSKPVR